MELLYLLGMGPLLPLLVLFYLIVMPVWLLRLHGRVKTLGIRIDEMAAQKPARAARKIKEEVPLQDLQVPGNVSQEMDRLTAPTPAAATREQTRAPAAQSFEEQVGGHLFQWLGIGALILALLFFLKWSFDNGFIGPTGRTLIGYLFVGAAMIAGDRLRGRYGVWALAFTGGGALGSYIVTWVALHTYHLFPSPIALGIFVLTTAVTCLLAGYYGAVALAAFGIVGGFLTPLLTGEGGSMTSLLLYILILDLGVFALGHMRPWRTLNALGLVGTALYEIMALMDGTIPRAYALAFIVAFTAIYTLVPYVYNLHRQLKAESSDLVILVGNAVFHFGLILAWLSNTPGLMEQNDALISLVFAVVYLAFSSEVFRRNRNDTPLVLASLSLTVLFASLAIPLQFGGAWVPLAWSIEGSFLLWTALTLRDRRIQRFAWIVMIAAYVWYLFATKRSGSGLAYEYGSSVPIFFLPSGLYLFLGWSLLLVVISSLTIARDDRREQQTTPFVFLGLAVLAASLGMNLFDPRSTLTGVQRFLEALALIGGGYIVLLQARRVWATLTPAEKSQYSALGIAVQIVTLLYLTREFVIFMQTNRWVFLYERSRSITQVGVSILWAAYGSAALIVGMTRNWKPLRQFSLILLLVALAKLTIVDLFALGTGARVIGFTVMGGLLVAASLLYQRKKDMLKSFFVSSSDHA